MIPTHHGNCNEKKAEQGTKTTNFATILSCTFEEKYNSYGQEIIEPNAGLQDPNQFSPIFIANSTEPTNNQNRIASDPCTRINIWFNQDRNQLTNFISTTEGRLGHQDPDNLSVNFNVNSAEGMENNNQLLSYNQNTIAPSPSTSNHATIVPEISDWNTIMKQMSDSLN